MVTCDAIFSVQYLASFRERRKIDLVPLLSLSLRPRDGGSGELPVDVKRGRGSSELPVDVKRGWRSRELPVDV